jgi:hypothetical protein
VISTSGPRKLWAEYSGHVARSLASVEELCALDPEVLQASTPGGRDVLWFLCCEVTLGVRAAYLQRLAEETLVVSFNTGRCATAVASVDRRQVLPVLPNLAGQMLTAALSADENNDTNCGTALHLLWLYEQYHLLDIVLPVLQRTDDWTMGWAAEWFAEEHPNASAHLVTEEERRQFLDTVDSRPFYQRVGRDRALAETYRLLWEQFRASSTAADLTNKKIRQSGPDAVLSYALSNAAADERYIVARFIDSHYRSGAGRKLERAAEVAGPDFVPVWLPQLLDVAARRADAVGLYRDLRRVFDATGRPDLVEEVTRAEWLTYGRHDDEGLIIQVRP